MGLLLSAVGFFPTVNLHLLITAVATDTDHSKYTPKSVSVFQEGFDCTTEFKSTFPFSVVTSATTTLIIGNDAINPALKEGESV